MHSGERFVWSQGRMQQSRSLDHATLETMKIEVQFGDKRSYDYEIWPFRNINLSLESPFDNQ
jgi:hypothetical protein